MFSRLCWCVPDPLWGAGLPRPPVGGWGDVRACVVVCPTPYGGPGCPAPTWGAGAAFALPPLPPGAGAAGPAAEGCRC